MKYNYKPSFDRTFKKLKADLQNNAKGAIDSLIDFFETGQKTTGLGLKHLRSDFWEIRTGLKIRILFRFSDGLVEFILVGKHEDIKRYLRSV